MRSGNADGAKGGRKMEAVEEVGQGKKSAGVVATPKQAEEAEALALWVGNPLYGRRACCASPHPSATERQN